MHLQELCVHLPINKARAKEAETDKKDWKCDKLAENKRTLACGRCPFVGLCRVSFNLLSLQVWHEP